MNTTPYNENLNNRLIRCKLLLVTFGEEGFRRQQPEGSEGIVIGEQGRVGVKRRSNKMP